MTKETNSRSSKVKISKPQIEQRKIINRLKRIEERVKHKQDLESSLEFAKFLKQL
jgi:hypothetical protein